MSSAEQDYYAEIVELRAELERARGERDAKDHECHRLRDVLCDRNEDLTAAEARAVLAERERDAARAAAATLRKWGATWREIAWGYELADDVQIFDNQQQLWATSRPRDCMGRRLDE